MRLCWALAHDHSREGGLENHTIAVDTSSSEMACGSLENVWGSSVDASAFGVRLLTAHFF